MDDSALEEFIGLHSKSFHFSSQFLPKVQRRAIWLLYAFCRRIDDMADAGDCSSEERLERLNLWESALNSSSKAESNRLVADLKDMCLQYQIPLRYPQDLIAGCKRDLSQSSYETFADLASYCYQVASTVGLMSCHILGFDNSSYDEVVECATKAGIALQLTNILRDVAEDLARGRIYLPKEDFVRFGCSYTNPSIWPDCREFKLVLRHNVARADELYASALPGVRLLKITTRVGVSSALVVYRQILRLIELAKYDVFSRRHSVSLGQKLLILPEILKVAFS